MPSISGMSLDPEGIVLIDDVIHVEETFDGFLVSVSIPDPTIGFGIANKHGRSLEAGKIRYGFTVQLSLSTTFNIVGAAFFRSGCLNVRALNYQEFDTAYSNASDPLHALTHLWVTVANGLRSSRKTSSWPIASGGSIVNSFMDSVNIHLSGWAVNHGLTLRSSEIQSTHTTFTSPLRRSTDRHNLVRLIRFISAHSKYGRGFNPSHFTPNECSMEHLADVFAEAVATERYLKNLSNCSFEHIAALLFAPLQPGLDAYSTVARQRLVKYLMNRPSKIGLVLKAASRLTLLELKVAALPHSKSHTVHTTVTLPTGKMVTASATRKQNGQAKDAAMVGLLQSLLAHG